MPRIYMFGRHINAGPNVVQIHRFETNAEAHKRERDELKQDPEFQADLKEMKADHRRWRALAKAKELVEAQKRTRRRSNAADPRKEKLAGRTRPSVCEVCGKSSVTVFDHCHEHGHFRGWLCNACNSALGMARDNPDTLRKLAEYLEHDQARLASHTRGATPPTR